MVNNMAKETVNNTKEQQIRSIYRGAIISARKVRPVADAIRGMEVDQAMRFLGFNTKKASGIISGIVKSAISNGVNNAKVDAGKLYVKSISVNEGQTRKAGRFAARGRFRPIRKRTSHIEVILDVKETPKADKAVEVKKGKSENE